MKNKRTPEIRFPGFTGDWKQRRLSELMEFSNGINAPKEKYGKGRKMINVMDILADGPIIYENIRNSVEVDETTESKNKVENGDLVFVRSSEIPEEVGWVKAYRQEKYSLFSGFSIRGKKKRKFDAKFIELSLNYSNRKQIESKAGGSTRFNVSQSILSSIVILEPSIEEQIEIGNFFEKLEGTIALHQQELCTLKQTKQGFLQKMFPKEGESVPEVRFSGFTGEWGQLRADEIFHSVSDKNHSNLPVLSASQEKGMVYRHEIGIDIKYDEKSTKNYKRVLPGQFVIHLRSFQGGFAFSNIDGITSPAYTVLDFKNKKKHYSLFWRYVLASDTFIKRLEAVTYGIRDGRSISFSDFSTLKFRVPSYNEQSKIGNYFERLDRTIALRQRELDALKETKKAFLKKMFA